VVDDAAGNHQSRIEGTSSDSSKRVPCPVVEPVPKLVEAIRNEILGGSEVEPRVNCNMVSTAGGVGFREAVD
jgi:hypothetical protein